MATTRQAGGLGQVIGRKPVLSCLATFTGFHYAFGVDFYGLQEAVGEAVMSCCTRVRKGGTFKSLHYGAKYRRAKRV